MRCSDMWGLGCGLWGTGLVTCRDRGVDCGV